MVDSLHIVLYDLDNELIKAHITITCELRDCG